MKFTTCLNCMDGRTQLPVINWIKDNYGIGWVDMITEPGMDGLLAEKPEEELDNIIRKIDISIKVHNTKEIFIAAHHDCIGNPVDEKSHEQHVQKAVDKLKKLKPGMRIIGLWVARDFTVKKIIEK